MNSRLKLRVFSIISSLLLCTSVMMAEDTHYGTWLESTNGYNSAVIKAVRDMRSDLSLKDAKTLVGNAPCYVVEGVTIEQAQEYADALTEAGGTAVAKDMATGQIVKPRKPVLPSPYAGIQSAYFDSDGAYFGPDWEASEGTEAYYTGPGAYYTGNYTSPFKTVLGKTDEEIQAKLDELWNHYFKGDPNCKVYFDKGTEAYICDINNQDVRSEGMGYGMMICVQTNHKEEFDKLWNWTKTHMWHKSGIRKGYFAWQRGTSGSGGDDNCAPDGEMYIMMSLIFAANRWNDPNYMDEAQYILYRMWINSQFSLFNPQHYVISFQPDGNEKDFSDPSYDLPAFVDLFARWSDTYQEKWAKAAKNTRDHLYKSSHSQSGLFSDYNNFDGTPHDISYNHNATKYMYDAMRCAMNFGMDYYLFGKDKDRQEIMAQRIINHFEQDGYQHARFNWDGTGGSESYTIGEAGCNAVACYALLNDPNYTEPVKTNMKKAWNAQLMTGQYRYYDGLVHYLAMLHLCGSFKIWKPTPSEEHLRELEQALNIDILGTTDINDLEADAPHADKNWYTLDGRSLHTKPTTKGIYLHENKKVMIP